MVIDTPYTFDQLMRIDASDSAIVAAADEKSMTQAARLELMRQNGRDVAITEGMRFRLNEVRDAVKNASRELDTIYNFAPLMIQSRIVPPVISEARDIYNQPSSYNMRIDGALYKIDEQAKFSSTPPNWRKYLSFPTTSDELLDKSANLLRGEMVPQNAAEKKEWQKGVTVGWKQGEQQADTILEYGLNRLNRDYIGMVRYHVFVLEGKISMPAASVQKFALNQSGNEMVIDETLLHLTTLPKFNGNVGQWKSFSTPKVGSTSDFSPHYVPSNQLVVCPSPMKPSECSALISSANQGSDISNSSAPTTGSNSVVTPIAIEPATVPLAQTNSSDVAVTSSTDSKAQDHAPVKDSKLDQSGAASNLNVGPVRSANTAAIVPAVQPPAIVPKKVIQPELAD